MDAGELASRSGTDDAGVARLVSLGLLEPGDGGFEVKDITRVRLALAIEASGISLEDVGRAIRTGSLSFGFAEYATSAHVGLETRVRSQTLDELGLDPETAARIETAVGIPPYAADDRMREDDAELLAIAAHAIGAGLPAETLIRTFRIFTQNLQRIAEYQNELFVRDVLNRMLDSGMSRREVLEASGPIRVLLVELGFRGGFLLHRRLLEAQSFHNMAMVLEELLEEAGVRRRSEARPPAIVFLDLSGYTRLTEQEGDEAAASHATALAELVQEEVGPNGGRIVKLLGDGVMLHFADASRAAPVALRLVDRVPQAGLPPARAGIAAGPMIVRDGDYFGRTVNLAARIADYARPREVVVSEEVVALSGDDAEFREIGPVGLKGVDAPVTLLTAFSKPDR